MPLVFALLNVAVPVAAQDAAPSVTAAPDVVVRQQLDPKTGAVIGQRVALDVDVLFRGGMPRPPRVSLPDVPGLQAFRFETQATTLRENQGQEVYVGQRFEFALYARRGGTIEIPPAAVTLLDRQGEVTGTLEGQRVRLEIAVPPGVDASAPVVATRRLTLAEQWAPDPKSALKPGDAVVRTIMRTAEDVPGLAMRDLAFPAPEGVRVYVDPPDMDDHSDRGVVTGRRVDRVTYLFERGGRFALAAVRQPWWDLAGSVPKTAEAAGATIEVAAAPARAPDGTGAWTRARAVAAIGAGAALLAALALGVFHLRRRNRTGADAEREAFAALRRACAAADAGAAYRAFSRWRHVLAPKERETASQAAAGLGAALFGAGRSSWSAGEAADLIRGLDVVRRARPPAAPRQSLPPLNP
jgi:hypothetical protein